jgi:hypothetical protein
LASFVCVEFMAEKDGDGKTYIPIIDVYLLTDGMLRLFLIVSDRSLQTTCNYS